MVDFTNPNICGASPELNDVLSKIKQAKADVTAKLDEAADVAASAFGAAQDELSGLKDKLQSIEIPTLPKLNLQAELAGLISMVPTSPAFIQSLAKIKLEFGDDIEAAGLELDSLITKATEAISGDGNICEICPNLEKVSGSTEPSVQKPIAPKQAAVAAVPEVSSVVKQNIGVETKFAVLSSKMSAFFTESEPPTVDTPAFNLVPPNIFKTISLGGGVPTSIAMQPGSVGERANYASESQGDGFVHKKATITETFSVAEVVQKAAYIREFIDNDGNEETEEEPEQTYIVLKHNPVRIKRLLFHTGTGVSKGYWDRQERGIFGLDPNIESTDANKGFYYRNQYGRHADLLIATGDHPKNGSGGRTNWGTFGNQFHFHAPVKLSDHPGNISSGGTVFSPDPDIFVVSGALPYAGTFFHGTRSNTRRLSDAKLNSKYRGMCVSLTYTYLERYDPEYVPSKTPPKKNTPVPVKSTLVTAQPTVPTAVPRPTAATQAAQWGINETGGSETHGAFKRRQRDRIESGVPYVPGTPSTISWTAEPGWITAKPPPAKKTTPPAEIEKIKSAVDRKPTTTTEDLQKIADADGFGHEVTAGPTRNQSGRWRVTVLGKYISPKGKGPQWVSNGSTPEKAFRHASNKGRGLNADGSPLPSK